MSNVLKLLSDCWNEQIKACLSTVKFGKYQDTQNVIGLNYVFLMSVRQQFGFRCVSLLFFVQYLN